MSPVYHAGWTAFRALFAVYFRWRVWNVERVPLEGPVILAANHASFLDPPIIGAAVPRPISYLARESLFRFRVVRPLLKQWNAVPVDRDGGGARGLRLILERLNQGNGIVVFPEGTRTHDASLQAAHSGIGLVIAKTSAPVVPVRTFGTFEAFGRQHRFPRPYHTAVKFGKPLYYQSQRLEVKNCSRDRLKQIYRELSDDIMTQIGNLGPWADKALFP